MIFLHLYTNDLAFPSGRNPLLGGKQVSANIQIPTIQFHEAKYIEQVRRGCIRYNYLILILP